MTNLRLYRIDDAYIRFMHSRDYRVQYNKGERRPYIGVVLTVGAFQYFAPLESPKPNHANIKPGKHIMMLDGGNLGIIGFNNMIPVRSDVLISFDISKEQDAAYRQLLLHQVAFINKKKADILSKANATYFDRVNGNNKFLMSICCDFKNLERAYNEYDPSRSINAKQQKSQQPIP